MLICFGSVELLEYSQKPWPRTVEVACGAAGGAYWTKVWQKATEFGNTIFIHANSKMRAIEVAHWCRSYGVAFKLYTSDKDNDSKEDFKQPDTPTDYVSTTSLSTMLPQATRSTVRWA